MQDERPVVTQWHPRPTSVAAPPRPPSLSTASHANPLPRFPLGRSPQRASLGANTETSDAETARRQSADSQAIFSIYSMYGSENGAAGPARGAIRRESTYTETSRTSSVYDAPTSISGYNTPGRQEQHQQQHDLTPLGYHHHPSQDHAPERQRRSSVTPLLPPTSFSPLGFDVGDSNFWSKPIAESSVHPPVAFDVFHPSPSTLTRDNGARSDEDDDDSLTLEYRIGSTFAGGSGPSSPTTPPGTARPGSTNFFTSPTQSFKKMGNTNSIEAEAELPYLDTGVMPSVRQNSGAPSAWSGANGVEDRNGGPITRGASWLPEFI